MTRLALILHDLAAPADTAGTTARLPVLETLLAHAERAPAPVPDWRRWVMQRAGLTVPPGRPPWAALALGRREPVVFATPVHLVAGIDHVYLHPAGLVSLTAAEQAELRRDYATTFGPADTPFGYLPLAGCEDAITHDPAALLGCEAGQWLPGGPQGAPLRRLMTEIQMWLHAHPVNAARARRGELEVNCLWLWGTGQLDCWPSGSARAVLASDDAALAGVWAETGGLSAAGAAVESWLAATDVVASVTLASLDADATQALARLGQQYLEPLAEALRVHRLERLEIVAGRHEFALTGLQRWRFWRRPRPWWENLA